jgi:hypothetical protein
MSNEDVKRPPMKGALTPDPSIKHYHKYFLWQTKNAFEADEDHMDAQGHPLYAMVEYAYLFCNCSDVVKTKVKVKES